MVKAKVGPTTDGLKWLTRLFNVCLTLNNLVSLTAGDIPAEWLRGVIVPILKGKRDIRGPGR